MSPCSNKNYSTNKLLFNVDISKFNVNEDTIYEFDNYESIKSIKIFNNKGEEPFKINFLKINKNQFYYVYFNEDKSETITNYIFNNKGINDLNSITSNSDFINYLKLNKLIENNFMIWSFDSYVIIKNDYRKN